MTLQQWADATVLECIQYANVNALVGEDWQLWGTCFFNNQQLGALHPPNPYFFDDWREYAVMLAQALASAKGSAPRVAA